MESYIGNIVKNILGIPGVAEGQSKTFSSFSEKFQLVKQKFKPEPLLVGLPSVDVSKKLELKKPLVFFDLETTGLDITEDRIFQGYFRKVSESGEVSTLELKVRPGKEFTQRAIEVTGIDPSVVEAYPTTFKEEADKLKKFLEGADLAGYNIKKYDIPLLEEEFKRAGIDIDLSNRKIVDVLALAQARYPAGSTEYTAKTKKLSDLFEFVTKKPMLVAHEAGADVSATYQILEELLKTSTAPTSVESLSDLSASPTRPSVVSNLMDFFKVNKASVLEGSMEIRGANIDLLFEQLLKEGSIVGEAKSLFSRIRKQGGSLFYNKEIGSLYFASGLEEAKIGGEITALPLAGKRDKGLHKMVQIGEKAYGSYGALLIGDAGQVAEKNFLQLFYGEAIKTPSQSIYGISQALDRVYKKKIPNMGEIGSLLQSSFTSRGMNTAAAQSAVLSEKLVVGFVSENYEDNPLFQAMKKYEASQAAMSMISKTGGRAVYEGLGLSKDTPINKVLETIERYKAEYLGPGGELEKFLRVTGHLASAPYVKYDYFGGNEGRLVVGSKMLAHMYGGQFEEHTVSKGLYQLAKVAETTSKQFRRLLKAGKYPFSPYTLQREVPEGSKAARSTYRKGQLVPVAVVETTSQAMSLEYFGESGSYYTKSGELGIRKRYPKGTITIGEVSTVSKETGEMIEAATSGKVISSPAVEVVDMAKEVFGIDFANEGTTQFFEQGKEVSYTLEDFERALRKRKITTKDGKEKVVYATKKTELTPVQRGLRFFGSYEKGKYFGLLKQLAARTTRMGSGVLDPQALVSRARLEPTGLSIDFTTAEEITPITVEGEINARRTTSRVLERGNVFFGKEALKNVSFLQAADEFVKSFGQQALLSNYIGVMNEMLMKKGATTADAAKTADYVIKEFNEVFGGSLAYSKKGEIIDLTKATESELAKVQFVHPMLQEGKEGTFDADQAFENLRKKLKVMKGGTEQERTLFKVITEGEDITSGMMAQGVKSVRKFWTFYAPRTDFMEDINMLKPIRMTLSKMATLSTAAAQLGYAVGEDPLFKLIAGLSNPWKQGHLKLSSKYGQIELGEKHFLREFATSLVTPESLGTLDSSKVVSFEPDGSFYLTDKEGKKIKLKDLPASMSQFKFSEGGVSVKDLEGTILDTNLLKSDIMYLDLGKQFKTNLLDPLVGQQRNYRYLPIPVGLLRLEGTQGQLIISQNDPSYQFIESIIDLQQRKKFDPTKPLRYSKLLGDMAGESGLVSTKSDIMVSFGTRARLAPLSTNQMSTSDLLDSEKLYEATITESEFEDLMMRKQKNVGHVPKDEAPKSVHDAVMKSTRESVKKQGFFMAAIGVDPMQRQEHMNIFKIKVVKDKQSIFKRAQQRIGQLNLQLHALLPGMLERDLDRDAANLMLLDGMQLEGKTAEETRAAVYERFKRQAAASKDFLLFRYAQALSLKDKPIINRLSDLVFENKIVSNIGEYLGTYKGVLKSLGYSITRGSEAIMAQLMDKGLEGAKEIGLTSQGFGAQAIEDIIAPYIDKAGDANKRLSVLRSLMQNVYQGAVQKGTSKDALVELNENIVRLARKYKGKEYNVVQAREEAKGMFERFLMPGYEEMVSKTGEEIPPPEFIDPETGKKIKFDYGAKVRALQGLDYIAENQIQGITKESIAALEKDLLANNSIVNGEINPEIAKKHRSLFIKINKAQAEILGEFLGAVAPLMASVKRGFAGPIGIVQKQPPGPSSTPSEFKSVAEAVIGGALNKPIDLGEGDIPFTDVAEKESMLGEMSEKVSDLKAKQGLKENVKKFLSEGRGKLAIGAGIGALATAGIIGLSSGPQPPPMPRNIDGRQPVDLGPQIAASPPRLYGNGQVFSASRLRAPEKFSSAPRYNFGVGNNTHMTIQDKRSVMDPYLLEQQMRSIANSDFNY